MRSEYAAEKSYYEILGVSREARVEEIKRVYREIARAYHPDSNFYDEIVPKNSAKSSSSSVHDEFFKILTAAYNTLIDPGARAAYDKRLEELTLNLKGWDESNDDFFEKNVRANQVREQSGSGEFGRLDIDRIIAAEDAAEAARNEGRQVRVASCFPRIKLSPFMQFILIFLLSISCSALAGVTVLMLR